MILADKIIEERKKNGWTQEDLAQKLGVSRQSVSKWESAGAIPDLKKIIQLADLFEVSTDYLLKDEIEKENTDISCDTDCVLRRWTKGYTIKQPNMDCQPTEITALMRHRAVFSWAEEGGIPTSGA